jgi:hypothetical protein
LLVFDIDNRRVWVGLKRKSALTCPPSVTLSLTPVHDDENIRKGDLRFDFGTELCMACKRRGMFKTCLVRRPQELGERIVLGCFGYFDKVSPSLCPLDYLYLIVLLLR